MTDFAVAPPRAPAPHNFGKPLGYAVVAADGMFNGGAHTFRHEAAAVADAYGAGHHVVPLGPLPANPAREGDESFSAQDIAAAQRFIAENPRAFATTIALAYAAGLATPLPARDNASTTAAARIADDTVSAWTAAGRMPTVAWDFRGLVADGVSRALAANAAMQDAAPAGLPLSQEPKYTVNGAEVITRATGEPIPGNEPIFIFRARDKRSIPALLFYCARLTGDHYTAVRKRIKHFRQFQSRYPDLLREPDTALSPVAAPAPREAATDAAVNAERLSVEEALVNLLDVKFVVVGSEVRIPFNAKARAYGWRDAVKRTLARALPAGAGSQEVA